MADELECASCGAAILARTAEQCAGDCMVCFKSLHSGRSPHALGRIRARGDEAIEDLWIEFSVRRFPAGLRAELFAGVCVVSLDSRAAGCVATYLSTGTLDLVRLRVLLECQRELALVLPRLSSNQLPYLALLSRLTDSVLGRMARADGLS